MLTTVIPKESITVSWEVQQLGVIIGKIDLVLQEPTLNDYYNVFIYNVPGYRKYKFIAKEYEFIDAIERIKEENGQR